MRTAILTGFCLLAIEGISQTTTYSCNNRYKIDLPNKLELQESELNTVSVSQGKTRHVNVKTLSSHITFQQKGVNRLSKDALNQYCRVIIEHFTASRREPVFGRGEKVPVGRDIILAIDEIVNEDCIASNTPLMKIISIEPMEIGGFPVLYYSFRRKGWLGNEGRNSPVIVNVFLIYNKYEYVKLTFSYRESEKTLWKDIHTNIIKSFTFNNKY